MDIFKRLTKGIKSSKISNLNVEAKSVATSPSEVLNVSASLPKELDFFNERPVQKETEEQVPDLIKEDSDSAQFKSTFTSTAELEAFKAAHQIRLSLHQTSDNATASNGEHSVHHVVELRDPEQILPIKNFADLDVDPRILERINQVRKSDQSAADLDRKRKAEALLETSESPVISTPTAVQMQAVPVMLKGRDMIVMAPTGSGKTLAFALGILGRLLSADGVERKDATCNSPKVLIISPTRELADQISEQMCRFVPLGKKDGKPLLRVTHLTKAVVNGWNGRRAPEILISTPLRLIHALKQNLFTIDALEMLILDEADRLLADGFDDQLDDLLVAMKEVGRVQKALFSATMPSGVEETARSIMNAPYRVVCGCVDPNATAVTAIKQELVYCGSGVPISHMGARKKCKEQQSIAQFDESTGKLMALKQMIMQGRFTPPCLIFVGSAVRAERLYKDLITWSTSAMSRTLPVDYLHSGRDQSERSAVIEAFREKRLWFLITTDVLARGLDFPPLSAVINYDFPDSTSTYIHRIGRTGRAGRSGEAYTFYTQADLPELRIVVNVMRRSGCEVPDWMIDNYTKSHGKSRLQKKLNHQKKQQE